jgi:rubrerythrin
MTDNKKLDSLLEPLQTALALERKGMQFFRQAAASTKGAVAQRTFHFLAGEEEKHIERIKQFYASLVEDGLPRVTTEFPSDAQSRLDEFNRVLVDLSKTISAGTSDVEAYETALAFENGAEDFYEVQMKTAEDPSVRNFYQWLINEEEMHARLIQSCLDFVNDPEQWFKRGEKES